MREACGCKKSCPEHLVPVSYFESYWEGWKDSVLIMQDIFTALRLYCAALTCPCRKWEKRDCGISIMIFKMSAS